MEARTDVATACAPFALAAPQVLAAIALLARPAAAQPKPSAIVRDRTFVVLKGHWDFSAGPSDDVAGLKAQDLPTPRPQGAQ
jgi:hypothetical protein